MSKHTPGPWSLIREPDGRVGRIVSYRNSEGLPVLVCALGWAGKSEDEIEANANVIRYATAMLEVLETIENDAGQVPGWLWERIQDVIAKAKGGPA